MIMIKGLKFSDQGITPQTLRLSFLLGYVMYGMFGVLDLWVYHENQPIIWFIRFGIIYPSLTLYWALTYTEFFYKHLKLFINVLLIVGQLGLISMIIYSSPNEIAFYSYYGGLILVILWSSFIFRLSFKETLFVSLFTILIYNLVAIFSQGYIINLKNSDEIGWYINNNFFLASSFLLSLIGAYLLEKREKEIEIVHNELIKEKKALEVALKKVEESNNLKTVFLKNLNHEIRTPMNGIMGFNNLIKMNTTDETLLNYSMIIDKSSIRLMNTIDEFIDMSLILTNNCSLNISECDLKKLIESTKANFDFSCKQNSLTFETNLISSITNFSTDREKLISILQKLIENSIKFTPKGGKINLRVENDGEFLIFKVIDNGIGIPADKLDHIFDLFTQANSNDNRVHEGNGLGLSIALGYTNLLGGKISVQSHVGKGSTFEVMIPIGKHQNFTAAL